MTAESAPGVRYQLSTVHIKCDRVLLSVCSVLHYVFDVSSLSFVFLPTLAVDFLALSFEQRASPSFSSSLTLDGKSSPPARFFRERGSRVVRCSPRLAIGDTEGRIFESAGFSSIYFRRFFALSLDSTSSDVCLADQNGFLGSLTACLRLLSLSRTLLNKHSLTLMT